MCVGGGGGGGVRTYCMFALRKRYRDQAKTKENLMQ